MEFVFHRGAADGRRTAQGDPARPQERGREDARDRGRPQAARDTRQVRQFTIDDRCQQKQRRVRLTV